MERDIFRNGFGDRMSRAGERFDQYGAKVFFSLSLDRPITPFMIVINGQHFLPLGNTNRLSPSRFQGFTSWRGRDDGLLRFRRFPTTSPLPPLSSRPRTLVKITLCIKHEGIFLRKLDNRTFMDLR